MTEAPERIWANLVVKDSGITILGDQSYKSWDEENSFYGRGVTTEYIRKDVSDALVAAAREEALREAVEVCTNVIKNYDVMEPGKPNQFASLKTQKAAKGMVSLAREDILALITKDTDNG